MAEKNGAGQVQQNSDTRHANLKMFDIPESKKHVERDRLDS
jgi:hypothetical protein